MATQMAIYFRATDAELRSAFPSFKVPLAASILRSQKNPFTHQLVEVPSWDPNPDEPFDDASGKGTTALACLGVATMAFQDFLRLMSLVLGAPYHEETMLRQGPALVGPYEPQSLFQLPRPFASSLAAVDDASVE